MFIRDAAATRRRGLHPRVANLRGFHSAAGPLGTHLPILGARDQPGGLSGRARLRDVPSSGLDPVLSQQPVQGLSIDPGGFRGLGDVPGAGDGRSSTLARTPGARPRGPRPAVDPCPGLRERDGLAHARDRAGPGSGSPRAEKRSSLKDISSSTTKAAMGSHCRERGDAHRAGPRPRRQAVPGRDPGAMAARSGYPAADPSHAKPAADRGRGKRHRRLPGLAPVIAR
jgi:hypothetical protein